MASALPAGFSGAASDLCGGGLRDVRSKPATIQRQPRCRFPKIESVSVFGIFRNGRMSPGSWTEFAATLSLPFSQTACQAAYTDDLVSANAELTSAVDDYAKENGVSDELVDRFAARAKGDTIMVISMTGQPARPSADAGAAKKPANSSSSAGQGNSGGAGSGPGGGRGMGPRRRNGTGRVRGPKTAAGFRREPQAGAKPLGSICVVLLRRASSHRQRSDHDVFGREF